MGEFYLPDLYDARFGGQIDYSPEEGVIFSYCIVGHQLPPESDVIFGVLATGEMCTLIGKFSAKQAGLNFRAGLVTHIGKNRFHTLAIGDFLIQDEKIFEIDFSSANLQEFFFPSGSKDFIKYSVQPLFSIATPFGKMEVRNSAEFEKLQDDISSQIYSPEANATAELGDAFKLIANRYPDSNFFLKKDIKYGVRLKFTNSVAVRQAYSYVRDITNLFALLLNTPVYPEYVNFRKQNAEGNQIKVELYPSMVIDARTIKCMHKHFHGHMPITQYKVSLDSIVAAWLEKSLSYAVITSSIQHRTGFSTEHTVYGEIILYATQLESISAGQANNVKYQYPVEHYGCKSIQAMLIRIFEAPDLSMLGKSIGNLRDELAHVGKPRVWLNKLSLRNLTHITQLLQLTVHGYVLTEIGVPKTVIDQYQREHLPQD